MLNQRIPNYAVKMGFGLHLGYSIEGAIGSGYKIDASYLSPNVERAGEIQERTKDYGKELILSKDFVNFLSPEAKKNVRLLGGVGNDSVFTVDLDLSGIEKEKNDFWEECETFIKAYGEEMVRDFYGYWTEDFQHGTGFRKQKEKTWNTARRLSTWARKQMEINNRYGSRNIGRGYDLSTPEGRAKDAAERIARNIQEECSDDDWMP